MLEPFVVLGQTIDILNKRHTPKVSLFFAKDLKTTYKQQMTAHSLVDDHTGHKQRQRLQRNQQPEEASTLVCEMNLNTKQNDDKLIKDKKRTTMGSVVQRVRSVSPFRKRMSASQLIAETRKNEAAFLENQLRDIGIYKSINMPDHDNNDATHRNGVGGPWFFPDDDKNVTILETEKLPQHIRTGMQDCTHCHEQDQTSKLKVTEKDIDARKRCKSNSSKSRSRSPSRESLLPSTSYFQNLRIRSVSPFRARKKAIDCIEDIRQFEETYFTTVATLSAGGTSTSSGYVGKDNVRRKSKNIEPSPNTTTVPSPVSSAETSRTQSSSPSCVESSACENDANIDVGEARKSLSHCSSTTVPTNNLLRSKNAKQDFHPTSKPMNGIRGDETAAIELVLETRQKPDSAVCKPSSIKNSGLKAKLRNTLKEISPRNVSFRETSKQGESMSGGLASSRGVTKPRKLVHYGDYNEQRLSYIDNRLEVNRRHRECNENSTEESRKTPCFASDQVAFVNGTLTITGIENSSDSCSIPEQRPKTPSLSAFQLQKKQTPQQELTSKSVDPTPLTSIESKINKPQLGQGNSTVDDVTFHSNSTPRYKNTRKLIPFFNPSLQHSEILAVNSIQNESKALEKHSFASSSSYSSTDNIQKRKTFRDRFMKPATVHKKHTSTTTTAKSNENPKDNTASTTYNEDTKTLMQHELRSTNSDGSKVPVEMSVSPNSIESHVECSNERLVDKHLVSPVVKLSTSIEDTAKQALPQPRNINTVSKQDQLLCVTELAKNRTRSLGEYSAVQIQKALKRVELKLVSAEGDENDELAASRKIALQALKALADSLESNDPDRINDTLLQQMVQLQTNQKKEATLNLIQNPMSETDNTSFPQSSIKQQSSLEANDVQVSTTHFAALEEGDEGIEQELCDMATCQMQIDDPPNKNDDLPGTNGSRFNGPSVTFVDDESREIADDSATYDSGSYLSHGSSVSEFSNQDATDGVGFLESLFFSWLVPNGEFHVCGGLHNDLEAEFYDDEAFEKSCGSEEDASDDSLFWTNLQSTTNRKANEKTSKYSPSRLKRDRKQGALKEKHTYGKKGKKKSRSPSFLKYSKSKHGRDKMHKRVDDLLASEDCTASAEPRWV